MTTTNQNTNQSSSYNTNYKTTYNPHATHSKASNIKVSPHAKQRAMERFGISKESEIKKLAARAKSNGIKIWVLTKDTYKQLGLDRDTYRYLLNKYAKYGNNDKSIYYQEKVFVFGGNGSNVLRSIVPCTPEMVKVACEKLEKDYKRYEAEKIKERLGT